MEPERPIETVDDPRDRESLETGAVTRDMVESRFVYKGTEGRPLARKDEKHTGPIGKEVGLGRRQKMDADRSRRWRRGKRDGRRVIEGIKSGGGCVVGSRSKNSQWWCYVEGERLSKVRLCLCRIGMDVWTITPYFTS